MVYRKKAIAAAMLAAAMIVPTSQVWADTFDFEFIDAGTGAKAIGSFTTTDSASGSLAGSFNASFAHLTTATMKVTGAGTGNGTFNLNNFTSYVFSSNGALNFASNLVGQSHLTDFNWFGPAGTPNGVTFFTLAANSNDMVLSCFYLASANTCGYSSSTGFTPNASYHSIGAAQVLDSLSATASGPMATAIAALALLTPSQQTAALEKLTPVASRGTTVTVNDTMSSGLDRIGSRLDTRRVADATGGAGFTSASGLSAGDNTLQNSFWLNPFAVDNTQVAKDGYAGYSGNGGGLAAGLDHNFGAGLIAGLGFSYANTNINYEDGLSGDRNAIADYQLTLYGSKTVGKGYVEGMLAYSRQNYSSQRDTVVNGLAYGDYSGDQWGVRIGGGLPIAVSANTTITPLAHLDYTALDQYAYTEGGAGALDLNVAGVSAERIRSSLGVQANYDTRIGGVKSQPFARVFWNHDFKNDGVDSTASFVGGGTSFTTPGQQLDRNTYTLGLGANFFVRENFTADISYDIDLGNGYQAQIAQATAKWKF